MTTDTDVAEFAGFEPSAGHNLGEQTVIGTCLHYADRVDELVAAVEPAQFYKPAHQIIFGAIRDLADAGIPVDPSTLLERLSATGELPRMGGGPYLHTCMQAANAGSAAWHAERTVTDWQRRRLHAAGMRIAQSTGSPGFDHETGFDQARSWVDEAVSRPGDESAAQGIGDVFQAVISDMDDDTPAGLTTGYADLDRILVGLAPGTLTIIAARPRVGKSVVGLNWALHAAGTLKVPVLFNSLEMRTKELGLRAMAAEASVPLSLLRSNNVEDPKHWARIADAHKRLVETPLTIDDNPSRSLPQVRAQLHAMARKTPAALWIGDYLTLFAVPKAESRQYAVAELVRGFKLVAREFGIPFVLLAQLNRESDKAGGRPPVLSDLRESGEIEQARDNVILLHRPDLHDAESPRAGQIDLILAKNRQGEQGTVTLAWQGKFARCMDMAPESWSPSSALKAS